MDAPDALISVVIVRVEIYPAVICACGIVAIDVTANCLVSTLFTVAVPIT